MKNIKLHLFSVFIIVLMLVFSLGTKFSPGTSQLNIINNSSKNIFLRITRQLDKIDNDFVYTEEFLLKTGKEISLRPYPSYVEWLTPDEYLIYFKIYDENMEIIKEYNNYDKELFKSLFSNLERSGGGRQSYFTLKITDEILVGAH
jgi:hypothetical protein